MTRFPFAFSALVILVASSANAQNPSTNIDVKADVKGACQIVSAAEINFNNLDPTDTTDKSASGTLTFWCTKGQKFSLSFNNGQNFLAGKRRMKGVTATTNFIAYELTSETVTGNGAGPASPITVQIPAVVKAADYRNAAVGAYKDTLTVTVQN
ncbi:MAG: spore coat protein U domain-containing protein [Rhodocyclaceae bacterium]|nr:spore coat protein U domain-containing protein [Rhodocyclaceae bacterium]